MDRRVSSRLSKPVGTPSITTLVVNPKSRRGFVPKPRSINTCNKWCARKGRESRSAAGILCKQAPIRSGDEVPKAWEANLLPTHHLTEAEALLSIPTHQGPDRSTFEEGFASPRYLRSTIKMVHWTYSIRHHLPSLNCHQGTSPSWFHTEFTNHGDEVKERDDEAAKWNVFVDGASNEHGSGGRSCLYHPRGRKLVMPWNWNFQLQTTMQNMKHSLQGWKSLPKLGLAHYASIVTRNWWWTKYLVISKPVESDLQNICGESNLHLGN